MVIVTQMIFKKVNAKQHISSIVCTNEMYFVAWNLPFIKN